METTRNSYLANELIINYLVEKPGFEPGQTEPKSVVLPLHHISIPISFYLQQ